MFTDDAGEFLLAFLVVVEEADHSLGQHLMVVGDEVVLGAIDTFAAEQGADGEAAEDLQNNILCDGLSSAFLLLGVASISKSLRS